MNEAVDVLRFKSIVGKNRTMNDSIFLNALFLGLIVMGQPALEGVSPVIQEGNRAITGEINSAETTPKICIDEDGNKYFCSKSVQS